VIATGLLTENEYLMNEQWRYVIEPKAARYYFNPGSTRGLAPGRSRSNRVSAARRPCGARGW